MVIIAMLLVTVASTPSCGGQLPLISADDRRYLDAGEALIEGELADDIGLGSLEADCRGRSLDPGATFDCTARSSRGPAIDFVGTISADGEGVDLASTNLLLAHQVEEIERFAAELISGETGVPLGDGHFECSDNSVVVGADHTIDCLVTDPADTTIHTVTVAIEDFQTLSITVDVGDPVG